MESIFGLHKVIKTHRHFVTQLILRGYRKRKTFLSPDVGLALRRSGEMIVSSANRILYLLVEECANFN